MARRRKVRGQTLGTPGGSRPPSARSLRDDALRSEISRVHKSNYSVFGARKTHAMQSRPEIAERHVQDFGAEEAYSEGGFEDVERECGDDGLSECMQGRLFRSGFEEIEYERRGDRRLFSERLVVFPGNDIVMARSHEERTIAMKYTTGPPSAKFADPLIRLREEEVEGYPPSMRLRNALKVVPIYMHHNIPQAVIGEQLGVSQPTVSRAIKALTEAVSRTLAVLLLTAEEVPEDCPIRSRTPFRRSPG